MNRYNLRTLGNLKSQTTLVFAHGFASNQEAWRFIHPIFQKHYRIVLFNFAGALSFKADDFNVLRYNTFQDYANDLIYILNNQGMKDVILVAHSVSCMIGTLVHLKQPELFKALIFISASPRYLDDGDYQGGFSKQKVSEILSGLADNYAEWIKTHASLVINAPNKPELSEEFASSLMQLRPDIALVIFGMIMRSDCRNQVAKIQVPTLIIQPKEDIFVPATVGDYLHQVIPHNEIVYTNATGHFPHLSNPSEIISILTKYLNNF